MIERRKRRFDILSVGELLVDLISSEFVSNFSEAQHYTRLPGGSPANIGMNMARLGNQVCLVATVGSDGMGAFLKEKMDQLGMDCSFLRKADEPTTLILVTRSKEVPDFEAYRGADQHILPQQLPEELLGQTSLFHTTCFALSKSPARETILEAASKAIVNGCQLSIDANYAAKIWPDREEAVEIVNRYFSMGAIVKMSEVDWERLYGTPMKEPREAADFLLSQGASQVCITLGADGCLVADLDNKAYLPGRPVKVKDTTGAGDAFWSGYLTAWLDGYELRDCALAGRRMAELKLEKFGALPRVVERSQIYSDIADFQNYPSGGSS